MASTTDRLPLAFALDPCGAALLERREPAVQHLEARRFGPREARQAEVPAHIGVDQPDRRKEAGPRRHEHFAHAHVARNLGRVQRSRAPECDKGKLARVFALLHRDHPHRAHHVDVDDLDHARRGFDRIDTDLTRQIIDHRPRLLSCRRLVG